VKRYRVLITPMARLDILREVIYIAERSPQNSRKWRTGLAKSIKSLSRMPLRCAEAPEAQFFAEDIRHFIYHSHRVIFRVEANIVRILRVRHGSRLPIGNPEADSQRLE
jgi:plasmid stabilization system protein ParE